MAKKMILCLVIAIMCVASLGCVNINVSVKYTSNGQIVQQVDVVFDSDEIMALGYDYPSIFISEVRRIAEDEVEAIDKAYSDDLAADLALGKEVAIYGESNPSKVRNIPNGFSFIKEFNNIYAYLYYNYRHKENIGSMWADIPLEGELNEKNTTFVLEKIQESYTLFNGQQDLINRLTAKISQELGSSFSISDNAKLQFQYITPFRRVHSNANSVKKDGIYYVHTWSINPDNLDAKITFWRNSANPGMWYVLALGAVVIGVLIIAVFFMLKNKAKDSDYVDASGKTVEELATMLMQLSTNSVPKEEVLAKEPQEKEKVKKQTKSKTQKNKSSD